MVGDRRHDATFRAVPRIAPDTRDHDGFSKDPWIVKTLHRDKLPIDTTNLFVQYLVNTKPGLSPRGCHCNHQLLNSPVAPPRAWFFRQ